MCSGVQQTAFLYCLPKTGGLRQIPGRQDGAVSQHQPFHRQPSPGKGAGFVGEQQGQTACRFNAGKLAHQHLILLHPRHGTGEHHGDHHGKSLRDSHDDHAQRQCGGVQQQFDQRRQMGKFRQHQRRHKAVIHHQSVKQISQCYQRSRRVSQTAHGSGQPIQPYLQGAFPGLFLQGQRHTAQQGAVAAAQNLHQSFAVGNRAAPEQLLRMGGVPTGKILGQRGTGLVCLAAFTGQSRLIALQPTSAQPAVGRNAFAGLQQHHVALHQIFCRNFPQQAVSSYPAGGFGCLLPQPLKGTFTAVFRQGRDQRGRQNGKGDACRFKPALTPK